MKRFHLKSFAKVACILLATGAGAAHARKAPEGSSLTETFSQIWASNFWEHGESRSGPGSLISATSHAKLGIEQIIEDFEIQSVLDVACGDFAWMSHVDLQGAAYTGLDIVPGLIEELQQTYGSRFPNHTFAVADMTRDPLPRADLVIARDVLGHLSFKNGLRALSNIRASGAKWFLTTTFIGDRGNSDIHDGNWRPVNLSRAPYSLGPPIMVIVEHCREHGGAYSDKALGLWPVSRLSLLAEEKKD